MQIKVEHVSKAFGNFEATKQVSFEIGDAKLLGLLGPSGGGKTTILRMLAGLESPDSGHIWFDNRRMNEVPPQHRGIGFVFQNYALFRQMNVFDNIAFGLTIKKEKKQLILQRVEELLELTGLSGLERRMPHQLSGGQRQRVAFARALAPRPQLLLLDEPFAAIDAKVRKELRTWLKDMINKVGISTIFVTHDQEEAIEVADEILIVNQGRVEQQGSPKEIYQMPKSPFVAQFMGEATFLPSAKDLLGFEDVTTHALVMIRPEFIELVQRHQMSRSKPSERGIIKQSFFRGRHWKLEVELPSTCPITLTAYQNLEQSRLVPGDEVDVIIHRLYLFQDDQCRLVENSLYNEPILVT